jgi:hypothetical protein
MPSTLHVWFLRIAQETLLALWAFIVTAICPSTAQFTKPTHFGLTVSLKVSTVVIIF